MIDPATLAQWKKACELFKTGSMSTQIAVVAMPQLIAEVERLLTVNERLESLLQERDDPVRCEVSGCDNPANWEGWWKVTDFSGNTSGLIQRRNVCDEHKHLLQGEE